MLDITNSVVTVTCVVNRFDEADFEHLYQSAFEQARACVDVMTFSTGRGLSLTLETFTDPNGQEHAILMEDPLLIGLCTAYQTNQAVPDGSIEPALMAIMADKRIMLALSDITATMSMPYATRVNCGRVIEGIGHMLSARPEKGARWEAMREALNLTEDYLKMITKESLDPRHGNLFGSPSQNEPEVRRRTWIVMDRFLHLRIRKCSKLPISEFPEL